MVDPLSALGVGLGLASLIIQIVDECVKGTVLCLLDYAVVMLN